MSGELPSSGQPCKAPVTLLDDTVISTGKPGPLWKRMITLYQHYNAALRRGKSDQALYTSGSRVR